MWWRGNDEFNDNSKVRRVRRSHPTKIRCSAAIGLWFQASIWAAKNTSDGWVPEEALETFDDEWQELVERLKDVIGPSGHGMLEGPVELHGETGYVVHDFLDFNDSRETQLANRKAEQMRVALIRDVPLVTAIKKRDKDRCRYCGCQVRWGNQRGPSGATYDHVKPVIKGGTNTLENVVIACRGCNSRKKHLTLRDAGMKLLAPGSMGAPQLDDDLSAAGSTSGSGRVGSGPQYVLSTGIPADEGDEL